MKKFEELEELILKWADEKSLLKKENAEKQYWKFLEEFGETAKALLKNDEAGIKDGFGDTAVTIIILYKQLYGKDESLVLDYPYFHISNTKMSMIHSYVRESRVSDAALVILNRIAENYGYDLLECLNIAWDEIKDRTGKTKDGVFIKS